MNTETANGLALCLANNPNNVADLLIVRDDGTYDRGWYASRIQLGEGVAVVTLASRPERRPQIASFDVAMEKLVAVKVELSSGEDHYFGERAMACIVAGPRRPSTRSMDQSPAKWAGSIVVGRVRNGKNWGPVLNVLAFPDTTPLELTEKNTKPALMRMR